MMTPASSEKHKEVKERGRFGEKANINEDPNPIK